MTRSPAQLACLAAGRYGDVPPALVVQTINTLVELAGYQAQAVAEGRADEAGPAIALRRAELMRRMG